VVVLVVKTRAASPAVAAKVVVVNNCCCVIRSFDFSSNAALQRSSFSLEKGEKPKIVLFKPNGPTPRDKYSLLCYYFYSNQSVNESVDESR
jgi:hypothetical protein